MTIPKPGEKIKYLPAPARPAGGGRQAWPKIAMETIIVVLLLTAAFMIGRVSALQKTGDGEPVKIVYPPLVSTNVPKYAASGSSVKATLPSDTNEANPGEPVNWAFAGSKSGKTYYPRGCKGLDRVKPENRVYWETDAAAKAAGYALSSTCD